MATRLGKFELPNRLVKEEDTSTDTYAKFIADPFESGYGHTIGNAFRRVLLSSIEGAAISSLKLDGVQHEFQSIDGVVEDVTDIVLNLKSLSLRYHGDEARRISLSAEGPIEVTAGMIDGTHDVEIVNPDLVICTLDDGAKVNMEMTVTTGMGYVAAAQIRAEEQPIGLVPIDAIYSPVRRVSFQVDNTRVGQVTDYDKLTMDIETDGTVTPDDSVALAARILQDQLKPFINFEEPTVAQDTEVPVIVPTVA